MLKALEPGVGIRSSSFVLVRTDCERESLKFGIERTNCLAFKKIWNGIETKFLF